MAETQVIETVLLGGLHDRAVLAESGDAFTKSLDEVRCLNGLAPGFKRTLTKRHQSVTGDARSKKIEYQTLTGYDLFDVVMPPYNLDYLAKLTEMSPSHYASIRAKVSNIVGLGHDFVVSDIIKQMTDDADTDAKRKKIDKAVRNGKIKLKAWLKGCNEDMDLSEILRCVWTDYEATGNGYIEIGRTITGAIGYIGHISSTVVRIRKERDGFVQMYADKVVFFRNFGTDTKDPFGGDPQPNEIIHIKKYSPTGTYYGVPDIISAKQALAGNEFAGRFNIDYFEHKAVPRYIIVVKGATLAVSAQQQILEFFETSVKGKHHRTIYIPLPADDADKKVSFEMKPVEAGTQDASFGNYHTINQNEILMANGVPISKVTSAAGIALAAARDADKTFKEGICRPEQDVIENKLNRIFSSYTDMFVIKLRELSLTDEDTQSKIDERGIRNKWLVPNEVRARKGMSPLPGGDKPVELKPQLAAEAKAQAGNTRQRTQDRAAAAPDIAGTGRNAKGEGRVTA